MAPSRPQSSESDPDSRSVLESRPTEPVTILPPRHQKKPDDSDKATQLLPVQDIPDTECSSCTTWIYVSFSMAAVLVIIICWLCYIKYMKRPKLKETNLENNNGTVPQPTSRPAYTGKKTHISRFLLADAGLDSTQRSINQPRSFSRRSRSPLSRTLDSDDSSKSEDDKELEYAIDSIIVPSIFWDNCNADLELPSDFDTETAEMNILQN